MSEAPKNKFEKPKSGAKVNRGRKQAGPRSAARLASVQALYQLAVSEEINADVVVSEYIEHRLGQELDGEQYVGADDVMFRDVTMGGWKRRDEWDQTISDHLNEDWSITRLDSVALAILRAGVYELHGRPDVPTAVIINEYVDIAHAFFDRKEASFINGMLDKIAKHCR